jgi:hypothetical protein
MAARIHTTLRDHTTLHDHTTLRDHGGKSGGKSVTRTTRQEGAVMLVVMLILLVATALAGISLQSTQHELRAAGYNRMALQTQYVAESAMATTLAWLDETSMNGSFMTHVDAWQNQALPPDMLMFGEPQISTVHRHMANRTAWRQQSMLMPGQGTLPPLSTPNSTTAGVPDALGTLGPRSTYVPGNGRVDEAADINDYVVDLYDCQTLSGMGSPGSQINQTGSGTIQERQYYCVVTARGRTYVPGSPAKVWTSTPSEIANTVNRFMAAHDARGTVITPPIPIP